MHLVKVVFDFKNRSEVIYASRVGDDSSIQEFNRTLD